MRRLSNRSFEGAAGETVSVKTVFPGVGAVRVWLDGAPVAGEFSFSLAGLRRVAILAAGEPGERCLVEIAPVDGASAKDVILITPHDPMPIHHYGFKAI